MRDLLGSIKTVGDAERGRPSIRSIELLRAQTWTGTSALFPKKTNQPGALFLPSLPLGPRVYPSQPTLNPAHWQRSPPATPPLRSQAPGQHGRFGHVFCQMLFEGAVLSKLSRQLKSGVWNKTCQNYFTVAAISPPPIFLAQDPCLC